MVSLHIIQYIKQKKELNMAAKRILLVCIFQMVVLSLCFGQELDLSSQLTKEQMYKDFDEFVQIVDSSTQTLVRKIATGYDAAEEIRQRRSQIEEINSYGEFLQFLNKCLPLTMCVHARMATQYFSGSILDTQIVEPLYQAYEEYVNNIPFTNASLGNGFYYNGDYYFNGRHIFINIHTSDKIILTDFRLLKHNDEPVGSLKNSQITGRSHWYRWDYQLKQYYHVYCPIISGMDKITVEDYTTKKIVALDRKENRRMYSPSSLPEFDPSPLLDIDPSEWAEAKSKLFPQTKESDNMKIRYYDSLHILYIYMDAMEYDSNFVDSIKKMKGKPIDKIIWDVRDNFGGTDWAWVSVLKAIVKDTIPAKYWIGFRNTSAMRRILEDYLKENPSDTIKHTIPYLDNTEFLTIVGKGADIPDSNSLQYDGKIYILQNEFVASSTGSLLANAKLFSQFVTVGVPTGNLMGVGINPAIFQLPESKFTFIMEACVDLTDCKAAIDVFHDRPAIEIYPTLEEIIEMNNYGYFLNKRGDEFLFKHDYLFKKVVEME